MMRTIGKQGFSLYVHIPYCTRRCPYCHFYTIPDDDDSKDALAAAIISELSLYHEQIMNLEKPLTSLYFGGGTPTLLGSKRIANIIRSCERYAHSSFETTIEANPEHLTLDKLKNLYNAGVNRLSIGVQSLNDSLLKKLGRNHTSDDIKKGIAYAKESGFDNISIDLMYEIPSQTPSEWRETLQQANALDVHHISIYNLTIEPGTSFWKRKEKLQKLIPHEQACLEMWEYLTSYLPKLGWDHYEISAFCKENKFSHHNVGYWLSRPFLGLGPSAFSYWEGARFQNPKDVNIYLKNIEQKKLSPSFHEELSPIESMTERLAIELRVRIGVDLSKLKLPQALKKSVDELIEKKLATLSSENILQLTKDGQRFYDTVGQILVSSYL